MGKKKSGNKANQVYTQSARCKKTINRAANQAALQRKHKAVT
jgi:hypothetical protein